MVPCFLGRADMSLGSWSLGVLGQEVVQTSAGGLIPGQSRCTSCCWHPPRLRTNIAGVEIFLPEKKGSDYRLWPFPRVSRGVAHAVVTSSKNRSQTPLGSGCGTL